VLRGRAAGTIGNEPFELDEGDWVAFKNVDLQSFGVAPSHEVATLLWIGATRVKKQTNPRGKGMGGQARARVKPTGR